MRRTTTTVTNVAGFRLTVPPTVFHPKVFLTSKYFANFLGKMDLTGKRWPRSAAAAAFSRSRRRGRAPTSVMAIDINPNAAHAASINGRDNGLGASVRGVASNLMSGIAPGPHVRCHHHEPAVVSGRADAILPIARGTRAPSIATSRTLFEQARERLAPGGVVYLLLSSDSDLVLLGELIHLAHFSARQSASSRSSSKISSCTNCAHFPDGLIR